MSKDGQIRGNDIINDDVFERLAKLDASLEKIIKTFNSVEGSALKATNNTALVKSQRQLVDLNIKANAEIKEQRRAEDQLIRSMAKKKILTEGTARAIAKERVETQQINLENKRRAIQQSQLVGAYKKLSNELNIAKDRLKDIIIEQGEFSAAAQKQGKRVDDLAGRIRKADHAAGDFQRNVGNYPTAFAKAQASIKPFVGFVRQLVGAFGLIEGLRLGFGFIQDSRRIAREAKGVEFAFKQIGDTGVDSFERIKKATRGTLTDLDIKKSIVEFDNFRLSADQLDTILEFVSVRALQTGKSFDYLKDSATEAITKESVLRADNLGISQKALNEEIAKGATFLEAFGTIAKQELARAGDVLGEAENNAQKFAVSLENIKVLVGSIYNQFTQFDSVNLIMSELNKTLDLNFRQMKEGAGFVTFMKNAYRSLSVEGRLQNQVLLDEITHRQEVKQAIDDQTKAYIALNGSLGPLREGQQERSGNEEDGLPIYMRKAARRTLSDIIADIEKYNQKLDDVATREEARPIQEKIKALEKERDAILGVAKETKDLIDLTPQIAKIGNAYEEAFTQAKNAFEAFKDTGIFKEGKEGITGPTAEQVTAALSVIAEGLDKTTDRSKGAADELKNIYEGVFRSFSDYYNLDTEAFEKMLAGKEASLEDYASAAKSISDALFTSSQIAYENDIEENRRRLDLILNDERATEEQKNIARKKSAEEEKKLRIKQAKADRQATLVKIAVDTAQGIISALAQVPKFDFGISAAALATTIGVIGAAQAAFVAAQPLPQFFKGKGLSDKYEGPATWGEHRPEVKVGSNGQIEVSPNKTTPLWVRKDDLILKSIPEFETALKNPSSEVYKRVSGTLTNDGNMRTSPTVSGSGFDARRLEGAIRKGFKGVNNNIKIINRIEGRVNRY